VEPSEAGALFAESLENFTAARDALAKSLAKAGERERAASVKALRKPSVTAWALNQLSRSQPAAVERLLELGAGLRAAQRDALEGGDPDQLRDARRAHDAEVEGLADAAGDLLTAAGRSPGPAARARLVSTLQAAASDDDARELLRAGRLVHDFEASGFGIADAAPVAAPVGRRTAKRQAPPSPPERPRPPRAAAEARDREQAAAAQEARRLSTAAARAEARADRLAREAERAEEAATEVRAQATRARREAIDARAAADRAHQQGTHQQGTGARQVP
jgi:hypothetical protein